MYPWKSTTILKNGGSFFECWYTLLGKNPEAPKPTLTKWMAKDFQGLLGYPRKLGSVGYNPNIPHV